MVDSHVGRIGRAVRRVPGWLMGRRTAGVGGGAATRPRYLTVVFEIRDERTFDRAWRLLRPLWNARSGAGCSVSAMSKADEILRIGLVEEALDRYAGLDAGTAVAEIREVVETGDPGRWVWP